MNRFINTKAIKKEVLGHKPVYAILAVILLGAFAVRVYRVDTTLGFYFDQGRDAKVIWDLWHNGDFFLIGPTTGIEGIFRGPFYYYLIAPFYFLGGGNPVWPSVFLSFTTVVAIFIAYLLGKKIHSREAGLIAALISGFSFFMIFASKWLSNPTPMLVLSMLLILAMTLVMEGKRWAWTAISFIAGLSLFHFGSSGEFFYFPALGIFAVWQRKTLNLKIITVSAILFLSTAFPLVLFDIRNEGILSGNIAKFITKEETFETSFSEVFRQRIKFYHDTFVFKIFTIPSPLTKAATATTAFVFLFLLPKFLKNRYIVLLFLVFFSPLIGFLFFQGNQGNIYDYYLTGYYLIFILLFSVVLGSVWRYPLGKAFVIIFLLAFFVSNKEIVWNNINDNADGESTVLLGNEVRAVEWIEQDAGGSRYNADVYVPPVIPHAYDYLFRWTGANLADEQVALLYTLYEVDNPHPERLEAWLERQAGIGVVEEEASFGGITVQRRVRI